MRPRHLISTATLLLLLTAPSAAATKTHQKLYVLNSNDDDMTVVDVASHKILTTIEVGKQPHGIASPRSQDILYVSAEGEDALTVVDPVKDKFVKKYPGMGRRPNEIDVTADGRFVYIPALGDGVYEVFDTVKEKIVTRIPTDGFPHNVIVSPDDRFMYLSAMDRGHRPIEAIKAVGFPTSLNKKVYIVDVETHSVVDTIPTGNTPRPITVASDGKRLYVNTDDLLGFLVLDVASRKVVARAEYDMTPEEKATPSRSHGIGITPDRREVWSTDINNGVVHVFDVTQDQPRQIARLKTGSTPLWLTITPDGKTVFIANTADDTVSAIDVATKKEKTRIQFEKGKAPKRMLVLDVPVM